MTGITDKNSSGTTLVSYGYTYDAAGLVSQETRTWASGSDTDTLDYTYTNNDQLTGVTHTNDAFANESFSYDANGNRNRHGLYDQHGQRADCLAWLHVHLRRRRQHDHIDRYVHRGHVDVFV